MPTKKTTKRPEVKKVVKKAAKKSPAKKTTKATAKKVAKKVSQQKKPLVYADDHRSFWVTNGQVLNSLVSLRDALEEMEHEVYHYHAGQAHNDFANWVSDVLTDTACAADLQKAKTPKSAKIVVVKHLKSYSA